MNFLNKEMKGLAPQILGYSEVTFGQLAGKCYLLTPIAKKWHHLVSNDLQALKLRDNQG